MIVYLPLAAALLHAAPMPFQSEGGGNPQIRTEAYDPNAIIAVRIAAGYVGTIVFPDNEVVTSVVLGDADAWQAKADPRGNQLYVKAAAGAQTSNMHVVTTTRQYNFILSRVPESDPQAVLQLTILPDPQRPAADAVQPLKPASVAVPAGAYRLRGAPRARPLAMSDDGKTTRLEWPASVPYPAIYALDGPNALLLNARVEGTHLVIDQIWPRYLFRLDGREARAERVPERSGTRSRRRP